MASLVIGIIIFISSFVGTIVSYLEKVHGGSNSLHQLQFAANSYAPKLASIKIKYRTSHQSSNETEAINALTELEELSKNIASIRANLGLPIRATSSSNLA